MTDLSATDLTAAHEYFSRTCFNRAWDLIVKAGRTAEEDEEMIRLNQASLWHWTQRPDCTPRNRAVGFWQASRIHAILGHVGEATRYARLCLAASIETGDAFLLGYAEEAFARAAFVGGDRATAAKHVARAHELVATVENPKDRDLLLDDLTSLE
jgi:hypothetical protein